MTRLAHIICLLGMSGVAVAPITAQETPIGDHGARVVLGDSWARKQLDPNLGDNQFMVREGGGMLSRRKQAFAVVLESEVLLETPADFERMFDAMALYGHDARVEVYEGTRFTLGTRHFDADVNGLNLAYRLDLMSRDGLTFYIMAWSARTERDFLNEKVEEFLHGFQFPGPAFPWSRQTKPTKSVVSVEGYELSFSVRPFVLREEPRDGNQLANFVSPEGDHGMFIFEMEDMSLEEMLAASFEACGDGVDDFVEVSRKDFRIAGADGRMLVAKDETHTFHLLALPLERGRVLDVRYVALGSPETTRADRDLFLGSLRLDRSATVISLPEPVAELEPVPLGRNARTVFSRSKLLGDTTLDFAKTIRRLDDGRWLALGWGSAVVMTPGQPATSLLEFDSLSVSSLTHWRGRWFVANDEEEVQEVDNGTLHPAQPFAARCLAELGDDLLLVRSAEAHELLGHTASTTMGSDLLIRRKQPGTETVIAELPHVKVSMVLPDAAGQSALLLVAPRTAPWTEPYPGGTTCLEVDLRTGEVREMGEWHSVETLGLADRGWLVTGRPRGQPRGVYVMRGAGKATPLITGERILGVELADSRLVFTSDLRSTGAQPYLLYEVATEDIADVGPLSLPFAAQHLNRIGRRVSDPERSTAPATEAELRRMVDEANRIARDLVGAALPLSGNGIDALVNEVYATRGELEPAGRALLAMIVTVTNLDQGARWVASDAGTWTDWLVPASEPKGTAFAFAHTPANLLTSVLDDGEGAWNPGTSVMESARGRAVFFGLDAQALRARIAASQPANLEAVLESPRAEDVRAVLAKNPANVYFREQLWDHLVVRGHTRIIEELAREYANLPGAEPTDLRAWLAAWNDRVRDRREADKLAEATLQALRAHPDDAQLCHLLGTAFEKSKPEEPDYARTCYQRVLRIQQWGTVAEEAQEALDRLPR